MYWLVRNQYSQIACRGHYSAHRTLVLNNIHIPYCYWTHSKKILLTPFFLNLPSSHASLNLFMGRMGGSKIAIMNHSLSFKLNISACAHFTAKYSRIFVPKKFWDYADWNSSTFFFFWKAPWLFSVQYRLKFYSAALTKCLLRWVDRIFQHALLLNRDFFQVFQILNKSSGPS